MRKRNLIQRLGIPIVLAGALFSPYQARADETQNPIHKTESQKQDKFDKYVKAIFQIESSNNPRAERYEKHIDDWSYGLGQILTETARDLEKRHPELPDLGDTREQIRESLFDPEINRAYAEALFREELEFYQDPELAVAAYNSGHLTPRNARAQEMLNEIYNTNLTTDGIIGKNSKDIVKRFQSENGLGVDGIIGQQTISALNKVYKDKFPDRKNPIGIIPSNRYTPNHVQRFKELSN